MLFLNSSTALKLQMSGFTHQQRCPCARYNCCTSHIADTKRGRCSKFSPCHYRRGIVRHIAPPPWPSPSRFFPSHKPLIPCPFSDARAKLQAVIRYGGWCFKCVTHSACSSGDGWSLALQKRCATGKDGVQGASGAWYCSIGEWGVGEDMHND